ncbi:MAG TPA: hypothetical protein VFB81_06730 [Myxococcales bacterium]|nr:hypothetical protein [Myxococcales bacterium]
MALLMYPFQTIRRIWSWTISWSPEVISPADSEILAGPGPSGRRNARSGSGRQVVPEIDVRL